MASRPRRPCRHVGCPETIVGGGWCDQHRKDADTRPDRSARGYDRAWKRVRKRFIRRNPLCVVCQGLAAEIHHIIPIEQRPDLRLTESNLQALCKPCHSKVTRKGT